MRAAEKLEDWTRSEPFVAVAVPHISNEEETAVALLDAIIGQLTTRDRYDETLPVIASDFFGRHALLTSLTNELRAGKVCGIFGLRKTGKTSLVKELGRRFVMADEHSRLFVLRDLETLASNVDDHETGLIKDLTISFLEELRERKLRTYELVQLSDHPSIADFRRALHVVLGHCRRAGVQVVLALDEVESLIGTAEAIRSELRPEVPEFLGAMRSLVQENENFNVMLVGITSAVLESGQLYLRENPLFSWAKAFYLPPLSRAEADNLTCRLGQRMAVLWDDAALEAQFAESGGHVFLHRTLASQIVGNLPNLQHAGEAGAAWLVISRVPGSRYPLVDGSSVTVDSASHRMRSLHEDKLSDLPGITAKDVGIISRFSGGSRAIADSMIGLLASDLPRAEQVDKAKRVTTEVLSCSLKELGPDLLAWLERWVLERDMLSISTADVRNDALFELRAAGIGEIDPVNERVKLFAPPHTATWRKALDTALSDLLEAPTQWESVVADLFYIERRLRRTLATLLDGRYGRDWGMRLPEDMQGRIIKSFQRNASARVHDITDIGRPLDWVTFGDLFELIPRFSPTSQLDGLSVTEWRAIADAILPIRDRVSHMRLLRDDDRQAVRNTRWRITNASGA